MLDALMFDRRLLDDADDEFAAQLAQGVSEADAVGFRRGYILGRLQARQDLMIAQATGKFGPPDERQRREFHIIAWRDTHVRVIRDRLQTATSYDELFHEWGADVPL